MIEDEMFLPGTTISVSLAMLDSLNIILEPVINGVSGLVLSQVVSIGDNITGETIQNWVKRGFVPSTYNKRYYKEHIARIFLLNILKNSMQMETAVSILEYMNQNNLEEKSKNREMELFISFSRVMIRLLEQKTLEEEKIKTEIHQELEKWSFLDYTEKNRIFYGLEILVYTGLSEYCRKKVGNMASEILIQV